MEFTQRSRELFTQTLRLSEKDIHKKVTGDLLEVCCDDVSYWYGNGELITTNDSNLVLFSLDYSGFSYSWVILEQEVEF